LYARFLPDSYFRADQVRMLQADPVFAGDDDVPQDEEETPLPVEDELSAGSQEEDEQIDVSDLAALRQTEAWADAANERGDFCSMFLVSSHGITNADYILTQHDHMGTLTFLSYTLTDAEQKEAQKEFDGGVDGAGAIVYGTSLTLFTPSPLSCLAAADLFWLADQHFDQATNSFYPPGQQALVNAAAVAYDARVEEQLREEEEILSNAASSNTASTSSLHPPDRTSTDSLITALHRLLPSSPPLRAETRAQ